MPNTERVTYRPEGARARTIYLEDVHESSIAGEPVIIGQEVDGDGSRILGDIKQAVERTHVIQSSLIVKRIPVVMDLTYGEYVDA